MDGVMTVMPITTTEEKAQRRLEVKARRTLMMGISNEHQLKFNSIKDAKQYLEAVKNRFGRNAATKKTQQNFLKQQFENFVVLSSEMLDQTFNRLQKLVSQLGLLGEKLSQEDVNQKLLRSLSPKWNTHDLERIHLDDMEEIDLRWQMAMLTMRVRMFLKKTRRKLTVNGNETLGFDMFKVECYNYHKKGHFARECRALRNQENKYKESTRRSVLMETPASIALVLCDDLGGYDWSDQAEEGPNYALMAYTSSSSDLKVSNDSTCSKSCLETVKLLKSHNEQLLKDLKKSELMVLGYKTGLNSVEERLELMGGSTEHVADEAIYKELDDRLVRVATTASSLEAEQDSGNIHKTQSKATPNEASSSRTTLGKEVFVEKEVVDKEANDEVQKDVEEVVEDINTIKLIVDAAQVNVAGEVNVASIATTVSVAATIPAEEVTLAKSLVALKDSKPKVKGVFIQEPRSYYYQYKEVTVAKLKNMTTIGSKWVFRNKLNENGIVSRNKARLVAQGYNQQEGIDYDGTYTPVARLESIRILLAYAYALDFKLFQMDVKSAFLNIFINEEVYVAQPLGFIDFEKLDHGYKLKKALYGLKQAPKAWYDRLKAFLIKHEYKMGMVDNTLFTKKKSSNLIIVQIYVDDIIFGSISQDMCDEFTKIMHDEFKMSMLGELNFFLRLQIKQMEDGIFFNQSKYIKEMLKKFGLEESKPMRTSMSSDTKLTKDEECESVDSTKFQGIIGSLLYLTTSRPAIMFSVYLYARF
nr:retrovirus-related Pol polyprotein from transposon TNT 1-94 [Tanacetum cinerariifolium]